MYYNFLIHKSIENEKKVLLWEIVLVEFISLYYLCELKILLVLHCNELR